MDQHAASASGSAQRRPRLLRATRIAVGLAPIAAAAAALPLAPRPDLPTLVTAILLTLLYVVAFRNEFLSTRGSSVPTEPVLVAMLMVLPPTWIITLGLLAVFLGTWGLQNESSSRLQYVLMTARSAWNIGVAVAAVVVMNHWAPDAPQALVVTLAVAAQILGDAAQVLLTEHLDGGARQVVHPLAWTYAIDVLLAVVGYCITVSVGGSLPGLALVITPVLLMRLLAHDREQYYEQARDLRSAYTEVNHEARRDPMTGLLNRRGWEETLEETMAHLTTADPPAMATVLVADLDRLKFTNDTHGHLAGDNLICAFADLLADCAPDDASVARLGGDEFAVIVTGPMSEGPKDLLTLVREIVLAAPPIGPVRVSASLGQATYPPAEDLDAAVQAADHAARVDKEMRRMTREDTIRDRSA